ncbi:hypothetical protein [Burkholderia thailandensis]|uniref:hypothetical protein n=2 Tax=Burkholderia thailandensis TaxID=57975 RepID=UPI0029907762|nr:hypothetical protein [Burkholderia thailandensis]
MSISYRGSNRQNRRVSFPYIQTASKPIHRDYRRFIRSRISAASKCSVVSAMRALQTNPRPPQRSVMRKRHVNGGMNEAGIFVADVFESCVDMDFDSTKSTPHTIDPISNTVCANAGASHILKAGAPPRCCPEAQAEGRQERRCSPFRFEAARLGKA